MHTMTTTHSPKLPKLKQHNELEFQHASEWRWNRHRSLLINHMLFGHLGKHWEFTDTSGLVAYVALVAYVCVEHGWRRDKTFILTGERWYLSSLIWCATNSCSHWHCVDFGSVFFNSVRMSMFKATSTQSCSPCYLPYWLTRPPDVQANHFS